MNHARNYRQTLRFIAQHKITAAFIVFAIFSITLTWGEAAATGYLDTRSQELRTEQSRLLNKINSMPHPGDMEKGIINSQARFVIDTTNQLREDIQEISADLGFANRHMIASLFSATHETQKLRAINRNIDEVIRNIDTEISPYSQNLSAMTRFIEYNPRVDTTDLSLGSADSNERMDRLRNGLSRAVDDIGKLPDSEFRNQTLRLLNDAQSAQAELESSADTEGFISSFEKLQEEYIELAISEYGFLIPQIRQETVDINRKL